MTKKANKSNKLFLIDLEGQQVNFFDTTEEVKDYLLEMFFEANELSLDELNTNVILVEGTQLKIMKPKFEIKQ